MTPANSGVDALKLLEAGKFIGIVSDMRTPGGIDGSDVHDWLAAHRPEMVSRLIFITGDIVNEETAATLAAPAHLVWKSHSVFRS